MTEFKVPFIDLQQRFIEEKAELMACVERILSQGHLVMTAGGVRFRTPRHGIHGRQALRELRERDGRADAGALGARHRQRR